MNRVLVALFLVIQHWKTLGAVTLTKNPGIDMYQYLVNSIGFDRKLGFSFPADGFGQNVTICGVDMSSSTHIDNKKRTF